jgi:hypothetical protein
LSANPTGRPGRSDRVMALPESPLPDVKPVDALYVPCPSDAWSPPLSIALRLAREDLAVQQNANIHDRDAMVRAAVTLEIRLRQVLDALDADRARTVRPLAERAGGAA